MAGTSYPEILAIKMQAKSKLFAIESLDLRFSNGERRTYERMKPVSCHQTSFLN